MLEQLQNFDPAEFGSLTPAKVVQILFTLAAWCCLVLAYRGTKWAYKSAKARWDRIPSSTSEPSEYANGILVHLKDDGKWTREEANGATYYKKKVGGREICYPRAVGSSAYSFQNLSVGGCFVAGSFKNRRDIVAIQSALAALQVKLEDRYLRVKLDLPSKPLEGETPAVYADANHEAINPVRVPMAPPAPVGPAPGLWTCAKHETINPVRVPMAPPAPVGPAPGLWTWSSEDKTPGVIRVLDVQPELRLALTRTSQWDATMGSGWIRLATSALPGTVDFETAVQNKLGIRPMAGQS